MEGGHDDHPLKARQTVPQFGAAGAPRSSDPEQLWPNVVAWRAEDEVTTRASVEQFLAQRNLGLVGASRGGKKFGNTVLRELAKRGYQMSVVHPEAAEIDGVRCVPSVSALPEEVGGLVVVVPPEQTDKLVREAAARGIRHIWMQQGAESATAIELCRESGIEEVHGECILMYAEPAGFHRFHRWLWGLFGKLPVSER
ncbi:MAG: CoA-binding protein [Acidobacteria bacterium]|nr:CoA-binding protein [Acidobacteriota bacterium]